MGFDEGAFLRANRASLLQKNPLQKQAMKPRSHGAAALAILLTVGMTSCESVLELAVVAERASQDDAVRVRTSTSPTIYLPTAHALRKKPTGSLASVYGRLYTSDDGLIMFEGTKVSVVLQSTRPIPESPVVVRGIWSTRRGVESLNSSMFFDPHSEDDAGGSFASIAVERMAQQNLKSYSLEELERELHITTHFKNRCLR